MKNGYQYLENNFFQLCQDRQIKRIPQLLYIYLRGLYCRFQRPTFTWRDKLIINHLGISQDTLWRARKILKVRGLILYSAGKGSSVTEYTMLGTVLLPQIDCGGIRKKRTGYPQNQPFNSAKSGHLYKSKERVKNRVKVPKNWKAKTIAAIQRGS